MYGFIEPQTIQNSGDTVEQIQTYLQTLMSESQREMYLASYIDG